MWGLDTSVHEKNLYYSIIQRVGVWYWPGAALLALEAEEEEEEEGEDEEEEADWFSCLLWDALNDGSASLCSDLWTEHHQYKPKDK